MVERARPVIRENHGQAAPACRSNLFHTGTRQPAFEKYTMRRIKDPP
jgi:hypothetical protein